MGTREQNDKRARSHGNGWPRSIVDDLRFWAFPEESIAVALDVYEEQGIADYADWVNREAGGRRYWEIS